MQPLNLKNIVSGASSSVLPQIEGIQAQIKLVKAIKPDLRTEEEAQLLIVDKVAKGTKKVKPVLVNVAQAVKAGGADDHGFPRLAIATYQMSVDREEVLVFVSQDGFVSFFDDSRTWDIDLPDGTLPPKKGLGAFIKYPIGATASIPMVPVSLRTLDRDDEDIVLLFEVTDWELGTFGDPYLLKKVAGDIYQILGQWDSNKDDEILHKVAKNFGIRSS